ncbi:fimbrial protein [Aeromonas sp. sif2416]|uniref:fimbrial protein n=1 Tax=Aeromonas sp. sif2416 TaxID=2854793 RepID=UPI001C43E7FA|nr:fimbrial protein [Aeromonas sp. sif2416]MBV7436886.1 type 1 fimbrial protein [Aeromonas sp. sif2416]
MGVLLDFAADRDVLNHMDRNSTFVNKKRAVTVGGLWCCLIAGGLYGPAAMAKTYLGPTSSQINISVPENNGEAYLVANSGLTSSNTCHPSSPTIKDTEGKISALAAMTPQSVMFNGKMHNLISSGNPYFGVIVPTRDTSAPDSDAVAITAVPSLWYPTPNAARAPGTDAIDARFRYVLYAMPGMSLPAGSYVIPHIEDFLRLECRDSAGQMYQEMVGQRSVTVNVAARGCDVTSPANTYIDFGELSTRDFSAVGSTTGTIPSMINLQCDPNVEIKVTLSDQTNASNRTDIVNLTAASTAGGLGVQVVNPGTGTPYLLGPDDAGAHGINQYPLGLSGPNGGVFNLPLGFRYIQTGDMTSGTATALVGVTFSYQ